MGKWQLIIIMTIILLGGIAILNSNNPEFNKKGTVTGELSHMIKDKVNSLVPRESIETGL